MPNWCINKLDVSGDVDNLDKFRADTTVDDEYTLSLQKLVPAPAGILDGSSDNNWRTWVETNWGTKWDISAGDCSYSRHFEDSEPTDVWEFATAWAPPSAWVQAVSEQYPELTFKLYFDEPGMSFSGCEVFTEGALSPESWSSEECFIFAECATPSCENEVEPSDAFLRHEMPAHTPERLFCSEHTLYGMVEAASRS